MVTLPKTNSSHLKMDGWKMKSPFAARPIWRGELLVSGSVYMYMAPSHHQDYYIFRSFLVGIPYKPSFATVTGKGATPKG